MSGIARKSVDNAGGAQLAGQQSFARCEGRIIVLQGDPVQGHGLPPHSAPVMAEGSAFVRINGQPVCRAGDSASCGHASTGSGSMRINA